MYRSMDPCVCICMDIGGPPLVLSFVPPQVLPTLLFLSETLSLTSLEFAK